MYLHFSWRTHPQSVKVKKKRRGKNQNYIMGSNPLTQIAFSTRGIFQLSINRRFQPFWSEMLLKVSLSSVFPLEN